MFIKVLIDFKITQNSIYLVGNNVNAKNSAYHFILSESCQNSVWELILKTKVNKPLKSYIL